MIHVFNSLQHAYGVLQTIDFLFFLYLELA